MTTASFPARTVYHAAIRALENLKPPEPTDTLCAKLPETPMLSLMRRRIAILDMECKLQYSAKRHRLQLIALVFGHPDNQPRSADGAPSQP